MTYLENVISSGMFCEIRKADYQDAYSELRITSREYPRNATIILEGDMLDKISIVAEGSVRSEKTDLEGDVHIVEVFEEDSIFGLEVAVSRTKISPVSFISNEPAKVVYITITSIRKSKYATGITKGLLSMLADESIKRANKIEILAERSLRGRILIYLGVLQKKSGSREVTVRMSREQFAQYLCVNRSALSNELNKMKREGIIDFKGPKFRILK